MITGTSCNWTGFTTPTPVSDRIEKLERLRSAYEATRVNLAAYQRQAQGDVHVINEALYRLAILQLKIRVAEWSVRRARGY
jgi:hypothetical protein